MAATDVQYPGVPPAGGTPREVAARIAGLLKGQTNNRTEVTLAANAATTAFTHPLLGPESVLHFEPRSANAKAEGIPWVSGKQKGECTLNHANNAQADRIYGVTIWGG